MSDCCLTFIVSFGTNRVHSCEGKHQQLYYVHVYTYKHLHTNVEMLSKIYVMGASICSKLYEDQNLKIWGSLELL